MKMDHMQECSLSTFIGIWCMHMRISNLCCCSREVQREVIVFYTPAITLLISEVTMEKSEQFLCFPKYLNIPLMEKKIVFFSNNLCMHRKYAFQLRAESHRICNQQTLKCWWIFSHNWSGYWIMFSLGKKII